MLREAPADSMWICIWDAKNHAVLLDVATKDSVRVCLLQGVYEHLLVDEEGVTHLKVKKEVR